MDISTQTRTAEIAHPTFPELVVTIRKINRLKQARIGNIFNRMSRYVPVTDPTAGGYLRKNNADGSVGYVTERIADVPIEAALEALEVYVADIRGLRIDGEEVHFSNGGDPSKKRPALEALLDDSLDIDVEKNVETNGVMLKQTIKQSFLDFLLGKANDPTTFGDTSGKA